MVLAKAIVAVSIGVVSMLVAMAIGAVGNVAGSAIAGVDTVWDDSLLHLAHIVLANTLGLLVGFMLGVLIRNSAGAIVAYFVYAFVLPTLSDAAGRRPAVVPRPAAVGGLQLRPDRAVQRHADRRAVGPARGHRA